jgi:hypothetical protein
MNDFFTAIEHHVPVAIVLGLFVLSAIFIWRRA